MGAAPRRLTSQAGTSMAKIVVGVDGSAVSTAALRWALDEARLRGATVEALHAFAYPWVSTTSQAMHLIETDFGPFRAAGAEIVEEALSEAGMASGPVEVERSVVEGPPARALLDAASDADLLVVGSRGRGGFAGLLLGSVSEHCAHHAPCPVVIVRHQSAAAGTSASVVVGVDCSDHAERALAWAIDEATLRAARLDVVTAWQVPAAAFGAPGFVVSASADDSFRSVAEEAAEAAAEKARGAGVGVETTVQQGQAADVLVDTAAIADLLVVGSRGLGGFAGLLLGSVSSQCAHHAPCPLAIVR